MRRGREQRGLMTTRPIKDRKIVWEIFEHKKKQQIKQIICASPEKTNKNRTLLGVSFLFALMLVFQRTFHLAFTGYSEIFGWALMDHRTGYSFSLGRTHEVTPFPARWGFTFPETGNLLATLYSPGEISSALAKWHDSSWFLH